MEFSNLRLEKRPPLAVVTLDRPKALNALNAATLAELESAFEELADEAAIRVGSLSSQEGSLGTAEHTVSRECLIEMAALR